MDDIEKRWRKSSRSGGNGGACVEIGQGQDVILVRDTQDRSGPMLKVTADEWRRFADQVKRSLAPDPNRVRRRL
jgi:hypothetical protein